MHGSEAYLTFCSIPVWCEILLVTTGGAVCLIIQLEPILMEKKYSCGQHLNQQWDHHDTILSPLGPLFLLLILLQGQIFVIQVSYVTVPPSHQDYYLKLNILVATKNGHCCSKPHLVSVWKLPRSVRGKRPRLQIDAAYLPVHLFAQRSRRSWQPTDGWPLAPPPCTTRREDRLHWRQLWRKEGHQSRGQDFAHWLKGV